MSMPPIRRVALTRSGTGSSWLARLPGDLARALVGAQAEECGLAQLPIRGPLRVRELRDELRPHPGHVAHARRGIERRRVGTERPQLRAEIAQRVCGVAGADLADVAQARAIEHPDEERPELGPRSARRRVAADHELGLAAHLHLAPRAGAGAGLVRGAAPLRDDALPPLGSRRRERAMPAAPQAPRRHERPRASRHELEQTRASLLERAGQELAAARAQDVEHDVDGPRPRIDAAALQQLEPRHARAIERNELPVQHQIVIGQRAYRVHHLAEAAGQVLARARPEPHARARSLRDRADAVVFLLEDPLRPVDHVFREGRQHRPGHRVSARAFGSPVAAFVTSPPSSRAMSARSLFVRTERGALSVMSAVLAYSSLRFMSSHFRSPVRTSVQPPFSFVPERTKRISPESIALAGSTSSIGAHTPSSQIMTVPPPYSPTGMTPSKLAYSSGWSSASMASRRRLGSRDGPFGTAHDRIDPPASRRKS